MPKTIRNKPKFKTYYVLDRFYEYRLTKQEFESELEQAGFVIIESVPTSQSDGIYHEFGKLFVTINNHTFIRIS